jgi:regulator of cell morphogenesis and NO signaling
MTTMHETVGELVAERPGWARVFEELGIDYCCGGQRTLREACERRGLSLDAVLRRLAAANADDPPV